MRTLHVDIEGGWGGSSRSLYELVSRLAEAGLEPLVVHRQAGPVADRYRGIGVPICHVPEIVSYAPRPRNSAKIFAATIPRLRHLRTGVGRIAEIAGAHRAELIHLNYEGLFLMAPALKRRCGLPIVCHSRTMIPMNAWGRWLVRTLDRVVDYMFFITTREEQRFRALERGARVPGAVMWNIASRSPSPSVPAATPEAVYLGNIDRAKGTDRLLDIAAALNAASAPPLTIAIYGEARSDPSFKEGLQRRVDAERLAERIQFRGHTPTPERALARAFALVRPSRDDDPMGRDIIEAMSAGVPVLATGSYQGVVKPGVTGYLFDPFDAAGMARRLTELLADPDTWRRLSHASQALANEQFGGRTQVESALNVFAALVAGNRAARG